MMEMTHQLLVYLESLKALYEDECQPPDVNDHLFFEEMKREIAGKDKLLATWEASSFVYVANHQINLAAQQITATKENVEQLMLHSYYKDIDRKGYKEIYHSCRYILQVLLASKGE